MFIMKRFILALILILLTPLIVAAEDVSEPQFEEVVLEQSAPGEDDIEEIQAASIEADEYQNKTLKQKLNDIYNLEIYKYDKPSFLFKEILTQNFSDKSKIDYLHYWVGYNGDLSLKFSDDSFSNHYGFNAINASVDGYLKDNNADFRLMLNINPLSDRNMVQNLFNDVYIATNKIPHHRILVGNARPSVGVEGAYSSFTLPFAARSQISRNFSTVRKLGAKVAGNYDLVDYDFGIYSSDTYFQEFFPGVEFVSWVNLKPLAKTDGKFGTLKIGGGIQGGHRDNDYFVTGAYVGWEYKRFMANFECAHASGYNGPQDHSSSKHASGFYTTIGYMLTKKLQLLLRYDEFDPDRNIAGNKKREFSAGINYYIKGQALKLVLNYVFCQNDSAKDSHRIVIGTQIML